ncbi:MAG: DUF1440 domain-containing protein [Armatimonadetes bacterium]|nr:DUF1440 domain-containing protein [Armatimonadota bacterium]
MNRIISGALAGFAATAPMTLVMLVFHRWPRHEAEPLPPQQITEEIAERTGLESHLDENRLTVATGAAHFGFGAAGGAVYGLLADKIPLPPALKGAVWGLMVWSVSYLGWIPAARILRPATQHSAQRNGLMIAAHLVWGVAMAFLAETVAQDEKEEV